MIKLLLTLFVQSKSFLFLLVNMKWKIIYFLYSASFVERQRRWKEELAEELERKHGKFFYCVENGV